MSPRIVEDLIPTLEFETKVIELDRRQPEFTSTFGQYLRPRLSETRIDKGRELYAQYRPLLDELTRKYGIPGRYLIAFWGLETNYGGYLGNMSTLNSLATLACDERRSEYFTGELFRALELVERHNLNPAEMKGSWAGAMGHTQFMPYNYARYGMDGDGDGRIQLWESIPDALTSAANFLQQLGWETGLRWGREVSLPKDFAYELAGRKNKRPLHDWAAAGVRLANGGRLPKGDLDAALLVPAGHRGPAFLVYSNFNIIMRWNNSEFYALSVGLLADRIHGGAPLHRAPPDDEDKLSIAEAKAIQAQLNALGYDAGKPDGILGPGTRAAIRNFQADRGMIADGYHSSEVRSALAAAQASNE